MKSRSCQVMATNAQSHAYEQQCVVTFAQWLTWFFSLPGRCFHFQGRKCAAFCISATVTVLLPTQTTLDYPVSAGDVSADGWTSCRRQPSAPCVHSVACVRSPLGADDASLLIRSLRLARENIDQAPYFFCLLMATHA